MGMDAYIFCFTFSNSNNENSYVATGKSRSLIAAIGSLLTGMDKKVQDSEGKIKPILVCAASNSALDEIVSRLKEKGYGINLSASDLVLLETHNSRLRNQTLEYQVESDLKLTSEVEDRLLLLENEQQQRLARRKELRETLATLEVNDTREKLQAEFQTLSSQIRHYGYVIDTRKDHLLRVNRSKAIARSKKEEEILSNAKIICATVYDSDHYLLRKLNMTFEAIIIDDASQCSELATLIPLRFRANRCIMTGDSYILSQVSKTSLVSQYRQSLFDRMIFCNPDRCYKYFTIQYRMHQDITRFLGTEFYKRSFGLDEGTKNRTTREWHKYYFTPYRFFDVTLLEEEAKPSSKVVSKAEASVAVQLYKAITTLNRSEEQMGKIAILSPYISQIALLKLTFEIELGSKKANNIRFATVDNFRGQETDIILFSAVGTLKDAVGDGYFDNTRLLTIALSRAAAALWILGSEDSLKNNPVWDHLISDAKRRKLFSVCRKGFLETIDLKAPGVLKSLPPAPMETVNLSSLSSSQSSSNSAAKAKSAAQLLVSKSVQPAVKAVAPLPDAVNQSKPTNDSSQLKRNSEVLIANDDRSSDGYKRRAGETEHDKKGGSSSSYIRGASEEDMFFDAYEGLPQSGNQEQVNIRDQPPAQFSVSTSQVCIIFADFEASV